MADEPKLSFSRITEALDPLQRTKIYRITEIKWDPPVELEVRYAGPENEAYWRESLEYSVANVGAMDDAPPPKFNTHAERVRWTQERTTRVFDKQDANDLFCYPRHIVTNVTGLVDDGGRPVSYSQHAVELLLRALPKHVRFRCFEWCRVAGNFYGILERPKLITPADAEALAGNS